MKTPKRQGALEFINEILSARNRLALAKSKLELAAARVRAARRRSRENLRVVYSEQNQVMQAKDEFIRARDILVKMEKRYVATLQAKGFKLKSNLTRRIVRSTGKATGARPVMREKKPVIAFRDFDLPLSISALLLGKDHPSKPIHHH